MNTKRLLALALTIAALPFLNAAEGPANGLSIRTKAFGSAAAEQRAQAVDAGDLITTPKGPRQLLRWGGAVAVSTDEASQDAILGAATTKGGALEGYFVHAKLGKGLAILKGPAAEVEQHRKSAAALGQMIAAARKAPGIRSANPVFIDSDSGLWCVTTAEIIIHLKPGVNAPDYFGADWNRVRALAGTTDHFILTLLTPVADAVLAESRRHAGDPRVQSSQPNFVMQAIQHSVPNDPSFASQWHLRNTGQGGGISNADVRATQAWDITTGSPNIVVAVIDDGVQTTHPDLLPNIATNALEIAGNSIDDDGNGYVDDVIGWNFYDGNNNPNPVAADDNHGTACAGIAVARGNNNTGIAGIAYTSRLMPVRLAGVGSVSVAAIVESIYYSAGRTKNGLGTWRGADVISISLGFSQYSVIDDALSWAATNGRGGKGCLVFVASGNNAGGWRVQGITVPSGTFTFAFTYRKNASGSAGDDAAWLAEVAFPNGTRERFNGATFPPAGWTTSGNANWTRYTGSDHAWGTSSNSARSGVITHNQSSTLQTTVTGPGEFEYAYLVSSEANADKFELAVFSGASQVLGVTNSGVPTVEIPPSYPANHPNVLSVGASTDFDFRAAYSQYGTNLDFVAPSAGGVSGITTTDRTGAAGANPGDYDSNFAGTSAACPLAAGIGALALSANTNLTLSEVRAILRGTSDKIGGVGYTNGFNPYFGYGRVNAQKAVVAALGTANDRCSNAIVITPLVNYSRTQSTVFAASALDQASSCGLQVVKDVWYKVTVASPGLLSITTSGSDFDTVLSTYFGSCGSLVSLQCNDDVISGTLWSSNGVLVTVGTYYIQAAGYNGNSGTLVVRATFTPAALASSSVSVSNVHARTATLLGNVNPSYSAATAWFEYGPNSSSFDFRTPSVISSDGQPFSFSQPIFDLSPGAIYYARVTVSNAFGISHSANQIFSAGDDRSVLDVAVAGDWVFGTSTNSPVGQTPPFAIDNTAVTKYLSFDKLNAGLTIAPSGNRIVRALSLISADDAPERDPSSFMIEGSEDGVNFTRITSNAVPPFPTRHFIQSFSFENTNAHNLYRLRFPTVSNALTANSMQIAEVELLPDQEITSTNDAVTIQFVGPSLDVRGVRSLFDRQLDDIRKLEVQFFVGGGGLPVFVDTIPATGATVVKGFQVIGAADDFTYPQRRPQSVTLFGSNDGTNYVQIASVVPVAPSVNNQIQEFSCVANTNAWTKYRIVFGPPVSGDRLQVGEMRMFGEVVPAAPALTVRASGGNVLVSWPAAAAGFSLEARTNFNTPGWLAVTNPPVLSNGLNTVTLPMSGAPIRFFQLRR